MTSTNVGFTQQQNRIRPQWSARTEFETWTDGQLYFIVIGVMGSSDSNAPRLNFSMWVLFEVDPSANITMGDLVERPWEISVWREAMRSTSCYLISGVAPLGQNNPSEVLTQLPMIGIFSMKSAARNEQLPSSTHSNTVMSDQPTWFATYVGHLNSVGCLNFL